MLPKEVARDQMISMIWRVRDVMTYTADIGQLLEEQPFVRSEQIHGAIDFPFSFSCALHIASNAGRNSNALAITSPCIFQCVATARIILTTLIFFTAQSTASSSCNASLLNIFQPNVNS